MDPGQVVYFNGQDVSEEVEINITSPGKWVHEDELTSALFCDEALAEDQPMHESGSSDAGAANVTVPSVVNPSRHTPVPLQASTELILSNSSASFEHVNQLIKGVSGLNSNPHMQHGPVTVKMEMRSSSSVVNQQQRSHVLKKILVVRPGDDPEAATNQAVNQITANLNKAAAQRMAQGRTPDKETVIEITRIETPAEGYFSRENLMKKAEPQRSLSSQSLAKLSSVPVPTFAMPGTPDNDRKHHRRKSPLVRRYMYRTPSPPGVKTATTRHAHNQSAGCYFQSKPKGQVGPTTASSKLLGTRLVPNAVPGQIAIATRSQTQSRLPIILRASRQNSDPGVTAIKLQPKRQTSLVSSLLGSSSISTTSDSDSQENQGDSSKMNDSLTNIQWLGSMSGEKLNTNRDIRVIASEKQIDQISRECGRKKRPPYSYMHLIQMAICSKPDKKMTLKEIYKWIEDKFAYYRYCPNQGWKNSIRHNLSLYDIFVREKPEVPGRTGSSFWTFRADSSVTHAKVLPNLVCDSEQRLGAQDLDNSIQKAAAARAACSSPYFFTADSPTVPHSQAPHHVTLTNSIGAKRKGPVPLLPKPTMQTYALIPVQNSVPLVANQPIMMSAMPPELPVGQALREAPTPEGLTTPTQKRTCYSQPISTAKRLHSSPDGSSLLCGGPRRKQVKIAPKTDVFEEGCHMVQHRLTKGAKSSASCTITSAEASALGGSMDTSDLGHQLAQMRFDSGFMSDTSVCDTPGGQIDQRAIAGRPRPKLYRTVLSSSIVEGDLNTPTVHGSRKKQGTILSLDGSAVSEAGLQDILSSIEKSLSPSMQQLLQTPPKPSASSSTGGKYNTSTPFKEALASPTQWMSPIEGLTPITGDANLGTNLFTPPVLDEKPAVPFKTECTPEKIDPNQSPGGSTPMPVFCFPDLTPMKTPFKTPPLRSPKAENAEQSPDDSFGIHNLSFMKLLGDVHLDSMIDEGIHLDVSNMSFSALQ